MASIKVIPSATKGQGNPIWFKSTIEGLTGMVSYTLTISYPDGEAAGGVINTSQDAIYDTIILQYNIPASITPNGIIRLGYKVKAQVGGTSVESPVEIITIYPDQVIQLKDNHNTILNPQTQAKAVYRGEQSIGDLIPYKFIHSYNSNNDEHTFTSYGIKPTSNYILGIFQATAAGINESDFRGIFKSNELSSPNYNKVLTLTSITGQEIPNDLFQSGAIVTIGIDLVNDNLYILSSAGGSSGEAIQIFSLNFLSTNWALNGTSGRYEQTVNIPAGYEITENDLIYSSPSNGSLAWGYDIRIDTINATNIKASCLQNPGTVISYKFTIIGVKTLEVSGLDIHMTDANAHANIELNV